MPTSFSSQLQEKLREISKRVSWIAVVDHSSSIESRLICKAVDWGKATRSVSYLDTWGEVRVVSNQAATVFETSGPVPSSAVWTLPGVTTVVWTTQSRRECYKFRLPEALKESWTERTLQINHTTLGGVTDQVQNFKVANRNGSAPIEWISIIDTTEDSFSATRESLKILEMVPLDSPSDDE